MLFNIFTKNGLIQFLYMLPALLISLSVHEYFHAHVAYKLGDKSQKYFGRLTLDPFAHIDWFGLISIMLIGIGWGKPVMVDDSNFKNRSKDNMLVSLAGPLSNLVLAFAITIVTKILMMFNIINLADLQNASATSTIVILTNMLYLTVVFNVTFAVFNMLPFPPFDGAKVFSYFLPKKGKNFIQKLEPYSLIIVLVLFITNLYSYIISPIIYGIGNILLWILNI